MKIQSLLIFTILLTIFTNANSQLLRMPLMKLEKEEVDQSQLDDSFLEKSGVDLINHNNRNYYGVIHLGSPSKALNVILDTGSSILWVRDSTKFSSPYNGLNCSKSRTCKPDLKFTKNITYGKGFMSGHRILEQLNLGSLTIPNYHLLLAQRVDNIPARLDGVLGLSFSQKDPTFPSVLDRLLSAKLINSRTFSMYLGDNPNARGEVTGELIFGGYDPEYALNDFQFVQVKEQIHWAADLLGVNLGPTKAVSNRTLPIIFDSGASLLHLPRDIMQNIIAHADSLGGNCEKMEDSTKYQCDCQIVSQMPDLIFNFNGTSFNIPASGYFQPRSVSECELLIQQMREVRHAKFEGVLGDVFLKHYYALYSVDNKTVGFAKAAPLKNQNTSIDSKGNSQANLIPGSIDENTATNHNTGVISDIGNSDNEINNEFIPQWQALLILGVAFIVFSVGMCVWFCRKGKSERVGKMNLEKVIHQMTRNGQFIKEYEERLLNSQL